MSWRRAPTVLLVVAAIVLSAACSRESDEDLRAYIVKIKAKKGGGVEALPEVKPFPVFTYQASALKNPFSQWQQSSVRPTVVVRRGSGIQPDFNRKKEPLEKYPLEALKVKGTIVLDNQRWAIIRAPDSLIYRVRTGDYIGTSFGKIISIEENGLKLTEIVPNGAGGWEMQPGKLWFQN